MKTYIHSRYYLAELFFEPEIFQKEVVEKIKTHIYIQKLFPKMVPFMT
jgi:hypothetical protein